MDWQITCWCRRGAAGAFVLACCAWAAFWSPVFLGQKFTSMIAGLLFAPHVPPAALAGWVVAVGIGLWLTISGIRPALEEGDTASLWLISLAAIAGGGAALSFGWHLPAPWGAFWSLGSDGLYVSAVVAGVVNVGLSVAARGYEAGYTAGALEGQFEFVDVPELDRDECQELIDRQSMVIAALTAERDQLAHNLVRAGPPAHDLIELLRDRDVRRAVLKTLHRDSHPRIGESEARAFDRRFQKASAIFDQLGSD